MAPAGFKGDEIRALFTGVSQAAATFGMSADKVDRVNYAFAQMASKGQVMSEELKGQLGDVLPGAMGIFAKAAGFEGADAIQKFGKALEDGAYKGKPMRDLLNNVTIELQKEFGPGAEGAARTYQGAMNRMANSTKLLYEAFEPVAVGFLNSVAVPLTSGIKAITDGFNAFFTGTQAKTVGGMAFAKELESLKPTFDGIRSNVVATIPVLQGFGNTLLAIGKIALQITGNPLIGYLGRLYLIVLPINMALGVLRGLWASNALQLIIFNARVATGTSTLTAFRGIMAATGSTAVITAGRIRAFSIALQAAFSATAVGLVVVGLGMIAEAFMTAGARADAARQKMSQFAESVKQLGSIGDVAGATAEKVGQQALAARLQSAKTLLQQVK
jgi:tape measure domain-containing protein